jgi:hypothetical protein
VNIRKAPSSKVRIPQGRRESKTVMKKLLMLAAVVVLAPGCVGMQRVTINTSTPGAQITVVKRGEIRTHGTTLGLKMRGIEQFEDQPVIIGTSPMVYDFQRVEELNRWSFGNLYSQDQKKVCEWLEIRATANGQTSTQIVPVNGDDLSVFLQMQPSAPPMHAASSLPPRS